MFRINNNIKLSPLEINKMYISRMDEEYKNICHFTFKDVYYVIPPQYEVYSICILLEDDPTKEFFTLLRVLEFGKYKGSFKTVLKKEVMEQFPDTRDMDELRQWCEDETQKVLDLCHVVK